MSLCFTQAFHPGADWYGMMEKQLINYSHVSCYSLPSSSALPILRNPLSNNVANRAAKLKASDICVFFLLSLQEPHFCTRSLQYNGLSWLLLSKVYSESRLRHEVQVFTFLFQRFHSKFVLLASIIIRLWYNGSNDLVCHFEIRGLRRT